MFTESFQISDYGSSDQSQAQLHPFPVVGGETLAVLPVTGPTLRTKEIV